MCEIEKRPVGLGGEECACLAAGLSHIFPSLCSLPQPGSLLQSQHYLQWNNLQCLHISQLIPPNVSFVCYFHLQYLLRRSIHEALVQYNMRQHLVILYNVFPSSTLVYPIDKGPAVPCPLLCAVHDRESNNSMSLLLSQSSQHLSGPGLAGGENRKGSLPGRWTVLWGAAASAFSLTRHRARGEKLMFIHRSVCVLFKPPELQPECRFCPIFQTDVEELKKALRVPQSK